MDDGNFVHTVLSPYFQFFLNGPFLGYQNIEGTTLELGHDHKEKV